MEYSAHTNTTLVEISTRPQTVLVPEDGCTLIAVVEGPPKQTAPVGICSQLRGHLCMFGQELDTKVENLEIEKTNVLDSN